MWPKALARRLGVEYPILLAPMAGGPGTLELAAAVSDAGALGSFAAGHLPPDAIRGAVREIRARTERPFAVNLFAPPLGGAPAGAEIAGAVAPVEPVPCEAASQPLPGAPPPDLRAQLEVLLEERVAVLSFTPGVLPPEVVRSLHDGGAIVLGTATTVDRSRLLEASGVDAIVAQGAEAGGHRAAFAAPSEPPLIGTIALVPQVVDAVRIPVVAAGGIMDGRGLVAAFALGASAVQMGTAFLACAESGADPLQKKALLAQPQDPAARIPGPFPGRPARAFVSRFAVDVERACAILPYPSQTALVGGARGPDFRQERADLPSLWAGQGAPLALAKGAGELVRHLVQQAGQVAKTIR
jgi:nitronate monooxygenase